MTGDPYVDPQTGVLRNRLGITDADELTRVNVNAVHPFRDGNGRTQRAFFGQLARDAGYRIDWSTMDRETNL
ncbi:MAG: Fic family protein, partial [Pseudonocardiaceae bacterium]